MSDEPRAGDLVRGAVTAGTERLRQHAARIPLDEDVEDVHQARVATRRLRSDLRTFRPLLDRSWVADVRAELRWLGELLGRVRDADVLDERLRRQLAAMPQDRQVGDGEILLVALAAERARDRAALEVVLEGERYERLLAQLDAAAAQPPFAGDRHRKRAGKVARKLVHRPWKHLRKAVAALGDSPADEDLHEVRKRAKQARYALEAVVDVAGEDARTWAKAVAGVQSVLGDLNDAVVAERWLRAQPPTELTAGLVEVQRAEAAASRTAWPQAWDKASDDELRAWM